MSPKDTKQAPPTEVAEKAERRRFTTAFKREVVREAAKCTAAGAVEALLRRRGLYSSHLSNWRQAEARGELRGNASKKRGPKPTPVDPRDRKMAEMERQIARLTARAERAETMIELQKKVAEIMAMPLGDDRGEK